MSTYIDDQHLLIHFFQDSLIGAALKWYMGLDNSNIRTFNDLGEAFIKQSKYNMFMAPDCDQLRAVAQKDKESFKEYIALVRGCCPGCSTYGRIRNDQSFPENPWIILL